MDLTAIFIMLIVFGFIFGIVYIGIRKGERQMMMEKGVDPSVFASPRFTQATLKFGLLFIGVAIGIFLGKILAKTPAFMMEEEAAYFSMIFLFGGLALVINYFIERAERRKKKE